MLVIRKKIFAFSFSIASKLRFDIVISAILPLLTVCFLSYLYTYEDFNVKKAETISKLNKQIDEIERYQLYFNPFCDNYFKNLINSEIIRNYIKVIENTEGDLRKDNIDEFRQYIINNVAGTNSYIHKTLNKTDYQKTPFYLISEIIFIGKNDWLVSAVDQKTVDKKRFGNKQELSEFGKILSEVSKDIFLKKSQKNINESKEQSLNA